MKEVYRFYRQLILDFYVFFLPPCLIRKTRLDYHLTEQNSTYIHTHIYIYIYIYIYSYVSPTYRLYFPFSEKRTVIHRADSTELYAWARDRFGYMWVWRCVGQ